VAIGHGKLVVSGIVDAERKKDTEAFLEPARNGDYQRRRLTGPSSRCLTQRSRQERPHPVHTLNLRPRYSRDRSHAFERPLSVRQASADRPLSVRWSSSAEYQALISAGRWSS
jgi:hypothetical protein